MNRRNVILGLGGLVAGGGVLVGTGAFDTVEAERTVSVETAGDADAFLALEPAERGDETDPDSDNAFVEQNDDGLLEITFGQDDGADGGGLNLNARTVFEELVTVRNQGTQPVTEITLEFVEGNGDLIDSIGFYFQNFSEGEVESDPGEPLEFEYGPENSLSPGDEAVFGLFFDLREPDAPDSIDSFELTLQITAEAED